MPLPKRRISKARGRKRRTHYKTAAPNLVECSNCHSLRLPHHVCPECGYYKGQEVLAPAKG